MSESSPHLVVRGVSKRYGPTTVLERPGAGPVAQVTAFR